MLSIITSSLLVFLAGVAGVAAGIRLTRVAGLSRRLVPFSGGVLLGIASFWLLPDMAVFFGWSKAVLWVAAGFGGLWVIDRYVYPVCPSCSHNHDHGSCATRLHGFAAPMLISASLHSFLDGWTMPAAQQADLGTVFLLGIALHKIPEGLALGVIVRAAVSSSGRAFAGAVGAQSLTVVGCLAGAVASPYLGQSSVHALLALAAGSFFYLGYHAIHGEYRRRGVVLAFMPALTGVAGSSVIRLLSR